ncbi:MAG: hypothetical protein H6977_21110 [Gammaproteobacteria bacterium]|nr:hypothetical protein [Gammaproteobacteria bacterium]
MNILSRKCRHPGPLVSSALLLVAMLVWGQAGAIVVADTLPYDGTPDWTDWIVNDRRNASMRPGPEPSVTLTTAPGAGVWFGWGDAARYRDQPAWSLGTPLEGNYLSLSAAFSADAADWRAQLFDTAFHAAFEFAPTGCSKACYGLPGAAGVNVVHAGAGGRGVDRTFVALDLSARHDYAFLLEDGQVSYRIDGNVVYSGSARPYLLDLPRLTIGDDSGHTETGVGAMTLYDVRAITGPDAYQAVAAVPLPTPFLLLSGALLALLPLRRRCGDVQG